MRRDWILAAVAVAALVAVWAVEFVGSRAESAPPVPVVVESVAADIAAGTRQFAVAPDRDLTPYEGYGTWVDVFDFSPAYTGGNPSLDATELDEMANAGVRTVYLQAARLDDRTPGGLENPWRLAAWIHGAHQRGMAVVAWYLPRFGPGDDDLERVVAMAEFEALGHRFDGVAIDIEWTGDGIDHETRSERLVQLSRQADQAVPDTPIGAVVITPVQMEVVNESFWPGFPWAEIAPHYDVWLPMAYWSFRSQSSGYGDGYAYLEESVRRLRTNIGDPGALVHGIGGIGGVDGIDDPPDPPEPLATLAEIDRFADAIADSDSIGASMYDWNTLEPAVRDHLRELFG